LGELISSDNQKVQEDTAIIVRQIRVLIADDHEEVLDDIHELLEAEFEVVGAVGDGQALLSAAESLKPDVIVTDISMPRMSGIDAAKIIIEKNPQSRIVLITALNDPAIVKQGFSAGALGYVIKMKARSELAHAIHLALKGEPFVSPLVK
jgi:DNA-binding NarL/FixJ family response regulator